MTERRYTFLRKRLDQLGYKQPLGLDSVPLVEKLFSDLVHTTESLKNLKFQQSRSRSTTESSVEDLIEPYRSDNAKLVRENNELHLELIRLKEELDRKVKDLKGTVRHLENENADLKFLNTQYVAKVKSLERESRSKSEKIQLLQEKNLNAIVETPGGKQRHVPYRRQRMDLNGHIDISNRRTEPTGLNTDSEKGDAYEADLLQVADDRISELESKLEKVEADKEGMERRIKSLRKQVDARESEIERLQKQLEGGRPSSAVIKDTKHDSGDRVIAHLNVQVDYLQQANRDLEQQVRETLDALQKAISKSKDLQEKNEELCSEIRDLGLLIKRMEESKVDQSAEQGRQLKGAENELENKRQALLDAHAELHAVKKEREHLIEENNSLTNLVKQSQEDTVRATELFEKSEKEKRRLQERNATLTITERDLVMELERMKISKSTSRKNSKSPDRMERMLKNIEEDRDFYRSECQALQEMLKSRLAVRNTTAIPTGKDKAHGSIVGMLRLMTEERDFYKREYELLRTTRDGFTSLQSPPTKDKLSESSSEVSRLRRERDELQSMLGKFERQLEEIQDNVRSLTTDRDNVQLLYEQATSEIQRLRRQIARARSPSPSRRVTTILDRAEKERDDALNELRRTRSDFQDLENQLQTLNENQKVERGRYGEKLSDLEAIIEKLELERNEVQARVTSLRGMIGSLEENLKTTTSTLHKTRENLADKDAELSKLRLLLEQSERNFEDARKRMQKKSSTLEETEEKSRHQEEKIGQLQREVNNQTKEIKLLQGAVTNLDHERDSLQQEVDEKTEELVRAEVSRNKQMKAEKDLKGRIEVLEEDLRSQQNTTSSKDKEVKGLVRQTQSLEGELADVTRTRDAVIQENKRLQEDLTTMTEENQNVHQDLQTAFAEQEELKGQVSEYATQVARVEELLAQKDLEKEELLMQYEALSSRAELLKNNVAETAGQATVYQKEAIAKEKELISYVDRCQALEDEIQQYIAAHDMYEQQLSTMATSLSNMEEQLRIANEEKEGILQDLKAVQDLCVKLDSARENMSKQLAASTVDQDELQKLLEEANNETISLRRQIFHEKDTVKSLENMISASREKQYYEQQSKDDIISQLEKTQTELEKVERERTRKNSEANALRKTLEAQREEIDQLKKHLTSERFERERLASEVRRKLASPKAAEATLRSPYANLLKSTELLGPSRSYPTVSRGENRSQSPPPSPVRASAAEIISPLRSRNEDYNSDATSDTGSRL